MHCVELPLQFYLPIRIFFYLVVPIAQDGGVYYTFCTYIFINFWGQWGIYGYLFCYVAFGHASACGLAMPCHAMTCLASLADHASYASFETLKLSLKFWGFESCLISPFKTVRLTNFVYAFFFPAGVFPQKTRIPGTTGKCFPWETDFLGAGSAQNVCRLHPALLFEILNLFDFVFQNGAQLMMARHSKFIVIKVAERLLIFQILIFFVFYLFSDLFTGLWATSPKMNFLKQVSLNFFFISRCAGVLDIGMDLSVGVEASISRWFNFLTVYFQLLMSTASRYVQMKHRIALALLGKNFSPAILLFSNGGGTCYSSHQ